MAEEAQFNSGYDLTNSAKRKHEDEPQRRATGFSAPISSQSPNAGNIAPASYNSVPPPAEEFQLAKRRAQEIAARLFNSASAQNGGGGGGGVGYDSGEKGFSSGPTDYGQKAYGFSAPPPPPPPAPVAAAVSYGGYNSGPTKKIEIPNGRVGVIIGKAGETIKFLQMQSGAKIQVQRDAEADLRSMTRLVELTGTPDQVDKAEQLIQDVLKEAETGGSGTINRRFSGEPGGEQFSMQIPNNKVGLVIGKGGETIKSMQAQTGARIQVIPLHLPPGDPATERRLQIDGTSDQIEQAKQLVFEVISENRQRNTSMGGGYSQGYQGRPQSNWGHHGAPPVQPSYGGYGQPGAYPAHQGQYNQASYGSYPQPPSSGGYAPTWDPSAVNPGQQATQGVGYDYYNQQQGQTGAQVDNTGYNYSQQQSSGYGQQGYSQDAYGGGYQTQPAYGQPQSGYDQQHNYNAAVYGNAANSGQEGQNADGTQAPPVQHAPGQQGYNATQQPAASNYAAYGSAQPPEYGAPPTAGYGSQPGSQPAYGQKPISTPPAYGQPRQQSPSAQGYSQGGYPQPPPPAQSGYPKTEEGPQQGTAPPSYSTSSSQPAYATPTSYGGAAPGTQPVYSQQPPPSYNSYGSAYSQPPAYASAEGNESGKTPPASQATAPQSAPKTSPQA